jgi:hypothetical protein
MRRAIFLAILFSTLSVPAQAQNATVAVNTGPISAAVSVSQPAFLAPVVTANPTSFLAPAAVAEFPDRTSGQTVAPMSPVTSTGVAGSATNSYAGTPLDNASQGTQSYSSYNTGEGPQGEWHVQNLGDRTTQQLTNLNLPRTGTMGLAPVFGTGNDGLTSPGGYSPVITIPFLGTFRIPSSVGLPGGGAIGLPPGVTNPSALLNTLTGN